MRFFPDNWDNYHRNRVIRIDKTTWASNTYAALVYALIRGILVIDQVCMSRASCTCQWQTLKPTQSSHFLGNSWHPLSWSLRSPIAEWPCGKRERRSTMHGSELSLTLSLNSCDLAVWLCLLFGHGIVTYNPRSFDILELSWAIFSSTYEISQSQPFYGSRIEKTSWKNIQDTKLSPPKESALHAINAGKFKTLVIFLHGKV